MRFSMRIIIFSKNIFMNCKQVISEHNLLCTDKSVHTFGWLLCHHRLFFSLVVHLRGWGILGLSVKFLVKLFYSILNNVIDGRKFLHMN